MKLFEKLFGKKKEDTHVPSDHEQKSNKSSDEWTELPAYVAASAEDYQLVGVIATAIAAGEAPESQFVVKKILQRNPEVKEVALISASLAAEFETESQLAIKSIKKKKV
ncbi:MAG TPA: hypothetical protein VK118_01315 [Tetragenococcus sp.]|nr:hypothetical protein [Tetragenococcus sp.]